MSLLFLTATPTSHHTKNEQFQSQSPIFRRREIEGSIALSPSVCGNQCADWPAGCKELV